MNGWSRAQWARRVDRALGTARSVNLGAGLPAGLIDHLDTSARSFHCENGIIGMGPSPAADQSIAELPNASSTPVSLAPGAAVLPLDMSFGLIRGGHLDVSVLGAYQVAVNGDLANWSSPASPVPAVGGAMDIAIGIPRLVVMMHHLDRGGGRRLVTELTLPATGRGRVSHVVTEFALMEVRGGAFHVLDRPEGISRAALAEITDAPIRFDDLTVDARNPTQT